MSFDKFLLNFIFIIISVLFQEQPLQLAYRKKIDY